MRIDPELRALRGDTARQRHAGEAMEAAWRGWRDSAATAGVLGALARYGTGEALAECPDLAGLFTRPGLGEDLAGSLVASLTTALRRCPLGQVPVPYQHTAGMSVLQLARHGGAALSLICHEECGPVMAPETICFADSERCEIVLAGSAEMRLFALTNDHGSGATDHGSGATIDAMPRHVGVGDVLEFPGYARTRAVQSVNGRLVLLRLSRTPLAPLPSREFRLSDGMLVHRASGDRRESRHEMMMALLGRMRRVDAAPVFAEMTRSGSDHLRWQALRECLALDTARGFAALAALAADPADSLAMPAGALKAQLVEAHPQLAMLENTPCPG